MTNSIWREAWRWHSRSKIQTITGKIGLHFWKLIFLWVNNKIIGKFFLNTGEITQSEKVLNLGKVYMRFIL